MIINIVCTYKYRSYEKIIFGLNKTQDTDYEKTLLILRQVFKLWNENRLILTSLVF